MIIEGTDPETISQQTIAAVSSQVELFCAQHDIGRSELGRAIGKSPAVVSEGACAAPIRPTCGPSSSTLDIWLEAGDQAGAARQLPETQFVLDVRRPGDPDRRQALSPRSAPSALVYGPDSAGIEQDHHGPAGHSLREMPGSIFITIKKSHASSSGVIQAIARGMNINDSHSNSILFDNIVRKLDGSPRLLIVDQIHNLCDCKQDKPLYNLADLHDATGAPQLWVGTSDMVDYLRRGQSKGREPLAQIRSAHRLSAGSRCRGRVLPPTAARDEPLYTIEEIREVFAKNKVRITGDGLRMLWELANRIDGGALRTCCKLVSVATIVAEATDAKSIDAAALKASPRSSMDADKFPLRRQTTSNKPANERWVEPWRSKVNSPSATRSASRTWTTARPLSAPS